MVGESKNLKLSTNTCFGVSFQKNVLLSFLLFLSIFYQDDLSDREGNEIASWAAGNLYKKTDGVGAAKLYVPNKTL